MHFNESISCFRLSRVFIMARVLITPDNLQFYLRTFGSLINPDFNFDHFYSLNPSDYDFFSSTNRIIFHNASLGLLFRCVTSLPSEISVDTTLASNSNHSHCQTPSPTSSPPSFDFQQAQDPVDIVYSFDGSTDSDIIPPTCTLPTEGTCPSDLSPPVSIKTMASEFMSDGNWGVESSDHSVDSVDTFSI